MSSEGPCKVFVNRPQSSWIPPKHTENPEDEAEEATSFTPTYSDPDRPKKLFVMDLMECGGDVDECVCVCVCFVWRRYLLKIWFKYATASA